jgi:hypothetical protein
LPRYNLIYPAYDISWTLVLWVLLPIIFARYCSYTFPLQLESCLFPLMDKAMILDFLHPFVQVALSLFVIKKLIKE